VAKPKRGAQVIACIEEIFQDNVDGSSRTRLEILEQEFNHLEEWQFARCMKYIIFGNEYWRG